MKPYKIINFCNTIPTFLHITVTVAVLQFTMTPTFSENFSGFSSIFSVFQCFLMFYYPSRERDIVVKFKF